MKHVQIFQTPKEVTAAVAKPSEQQETDIDEVSRDINSENKAISSRDNSDDVAYGLVFVDGQQLDYSRDEDDHQIDIIDDDIEVIELLLEEEREFLVEQVLFTFVMFACIKFIS